MKNHPVNLFFLLFGITIFTACNDKKECANPETLKKEIIKTEKEFEIAAKNMGIAEAFYFYADSNAVIKRGENVLIKGKENIKLYYSKPYFLNASVVWTPDFVDVSERGDLAYTYGKYVWQAQDSTCVIHEETGIFHTVWKKQKDGSWKYVWD